MNEQESLQRILEMSRRNLAILEVQRAGFGELHVPPHILIQIEDIRKKIKELEESVEAYSKYSSQKATPPMVAPQALSPSGNVRNQVLISYNHNDKQWLERLRNHLIPLERAKILKYKIWDDSDIKPGMRWRDEINNALDSAKIVILLVSADFLASSFLDREEFPALLKAAENDGASILSIIVSPVMVRGTRLSEFTSFNNVTNPLSLMQKNTQEEFFVRLIDKINELIG